MGCPPSCAPLGGHTWLGVLRLGGGDRSSSNPAGWALGQSTFCTSVSSPRSQLGSWGQPVCRPWWALLLSAASGQFGHLSDPPPPTPPPLCWALALPLPRGRVKPALISSPRSEYVGARAKTHLYSEKNTAFWSLCTSVGTNTTPTPSEGRAGRPICPVGFGLVPSPSRQILQF